MESRGDCSNKTDRGHPAGPIVRIRLRHLGRGHEVPRKCAAIIGEAPGDQGALLTDGDSHTMMVDHLSC